LNGVIYFAEESNVKRAIPSPEKFVESNVVKRSTDPDRFKVAKNIYIYIQQISLGSMIIVK
jgi:dTDP-D-glucose 4,6-dehydratase